jgi:hypothetical protein
LSCLTDGLKWICGGPVKRRPIAEASAPRVVITRDALTVAVPASGHWPGQLRASGAVLMLLAKGEPPDDPAELAYGDPSLHVHAGPAQIESAARREDISAPRMQPCAR